MVVRGKVTHLRRAMRSRKAALADATDLKGQLRRLMKAIGLQQVGHQSN